MADQFDPYREALIVETNTVWPEAYADLPREEKQRIEKALHADPENCSELEYVRQHTGFCRQINVTSADVERIGG